MQTPVGDSDISSLRFAICGAAPMPEALIRAFEARAPESIGAAAAGEKRSLAKDRTDRC